MITEITPEEIQKRIATADRHLASAWSVMLGVKNSQTDYGWRSVNRDLDALILGVQLKCEPPFSATFPAEQNKPVGACVAYLSMAYYALPPWLRGEFFFRFSNLIEALRTLHSTECDEAIAGSDLSRDITAKKIAGQASIGQASTGQASPAPTSPTHFRVHQTLRHSTDVFSGTIACRPDPSKSGMRTGIHYYAMDEKQAYVSVLVDDAIKWVPAEKIALVLKGESELEIWGHVQIPEVPETMVPETVVYSSTPGGPRSITDLRRVRLQDHASKLRLARARLLSVDTVTRIDACRAIDAALALVPKHGAENVGTFKLAPQKISRSMVGEVASQITALLDYMPRRSWAGLMSASTAWTVAMGQALAEDGLRDNPSPEPESQSDWIEREPIFDREFWKRVGSR